MSPKPEREQPAGREMLYDAFKHGRDTWRESARNAVWHTDHRMRAYEQRLRAWFLVGVLLLIIGLFVWQLLF